MKQADNEAAAVQKNAAVRSGRRLVRKYTGKKALIGMLLSLLRTLLFCGLIFMILYPLFVRFMTSLKSSADMLDPSVVYFPKNPSLYYYRVIVRATGYFPTLLKTCGFTVLTSVLQMASCTLTAYGLARFRFRGNSLFFGLSLVTLAIPPQLLLTSMYMRFYNFSLPGFFQFTGQLEGWVNLTNTLWPFVLLSSTAVAFKNGLYVFMLRQYFRNTPAVLEEAAYIDGCGVFRTFYRIMLPGAKPILIAVFLFSFVWQWTDGYYVRTLAPDLPILCQKLFDLSFSVLGEQSDMFSTMTSTPRFFLLILPVLLLHLFTQRFFTESIERTGVVG